MRGNAEEMEDLHPTVQVLANLQTLDAEVEVGGSRRDLLQFCLSNLGATEEDKLDGLQLLLEEVVEEEPLHRYGCQPMAMGHLLDSLSPALGLAFPTPVQEPTST